MIYSETNLKKDKTMTKIQKVIEDAIINGKFDKVVWVILAIIGVYIGGLLAGIIFGAWWTIGNTPTPHEGVNGAYMSKRTTVTEQAQAQR